MSEKSGFWSIPVFLVLASLVVAVSMLGHPGRWQQGVHVLMLGSGAPDAIAAAGAVGANPAFPVSRRAPD
ncbi:MAG TPA: hypothetical protein VMF62_10765 [Acetobacteraceae bacterium]|jgi:hypothetical protein|nr:hypothetical protein [Acetobacteraceae bacterium]